MNNTAVIEHIVAWMKDYVGQSHTKGFVVGVSGGIDSALTSTLAAKTGLPTLCLEMPLILIKTSVDGISVVLQI